GGLCTRSRPEKLRGRHIVVLAVEKKSSANVFMAFAGLTADARVLINRARVECQSHRLTVDDPITVEYITCYVSSLKQHYTQSNGRRPFGISTLIVGFDDDGTPNLYQTDPSGTYHAWKVGRSAKAVRELLEKSYREEDMESDALVLKLAVRALLEVGAKNIELATRERWSHEGAFAASTSLHAHPTFASAIRFWNQRR
uniref:Proteasome 20S subunit alpha 8 n=1 Tax=Electrophorus electricus TaxID=8005 RepID=A0AAY5EBL7_ELEEL